MGDNTFNRMYNDNTTSDTTLGQPDDGAGGGEEEGGHGYEPHGAAAPADSGDLLLSPGASPLPQRPAAGGEEEGDGGAAPEPDWQAPAFLPPYLQRTPAPAAAGAAGEAHPVASDHPALAHSPADTSSTMNTLETRRISVGGGDTRRLSVGPAGGDTRRLSVGTRRMSMQVGWALGAVLLTACLLVDRVPFLWLLVATLQWACEGGCRLSASPASTHCLGVSTAARVGRHRPAPGGRL